jgi:hypothetical protein
MWFWRGRTVACVILRRADQPETTMTQARTHIENKALVLDLVEWVAVAPRPYSEVMDAWRTSCPRLPIWEDATDLGFIVRTSGNGAGPLVEATAAGREFLRAERGTRTGASAR